MIHIKYNGLTYACDTPADAMALTAEFTRTKEPTPKPAHPEAAPVAAEAHNPRLWNVANMTSIPPTYAKLFTAMVAAGAQGVNSIEIEEQKLLANRSHLGGASVWIRRVENALGRPHAFMISVYDKRTKTTTLVAKPAFAKFIEKVNKRGAKVATTPAQGQQA